MCALPVEKPHLMTVAEFLDWDGDRTDILFDLVGGEPVAQARPSPAHATIMTNIAYLGTAALRDRPPCRVMTEAGLFKAYNHLTARGADAAITCEPVSTDRKIHPTVVFEVLSPSNRLDTMAKVTFYATLDSVEEIVLLDSERPAAIIYRRTMGDGWEDNPADVVAGLEATVLLGSLGIEMPMAELYRHVPL